MANFDEVLNFGNGLVVDVTLNGTQNPDGSYTVVAASGADGSGDTITGVALVVDGSDNEVWLNGPSGPNPVVDFGGLTVVTDGTPNGAAGRASADINIFSVNGQYFEDTPTRTQLSNPTITCYCRGTHILTERGEVAVEDLRIGDNVVTASGGSRPIVWIGYRELDIARHAYPLEVYPVRVRAGAFGRGLPHRDLWLSPQHAVLVDGVLIPIIKLASGATVAQIRVETVSYFHVELESHDVLLAEGLAAESFLDCGSRSGFSNAAGFVELHPTFQPISWDDACAPLKESGEEVEAARARLLAQAEKLGFRRSPDPGLHIRADGEIVWPEQRDGRMVRLRAIRARARHQADVA